MKRLILIKYGELTTKKGNRRVFINKLEENIKQLLKNDIKIIKKLDRMYIEALDVDLVSDKLKKIFGIQGIVIAYKVNTNIDDIKETVVEILKNQNFKTFKVDTKRANKNFEIKSMDFNNVIGSLVLKTLSLSS